MVKPKICILRTDGTNCDMELFYAFEKFGGAPQYVHVNELRTKVKQLKDYQILALPGGFSYGDDVASGKVLAVELVSFLKDQLQEYIYKEGLIIGICNGFQALVRTGLLPFNHLGKMEATLAQNKSGHFECRWIRLKTEKSRCVFLNKPLTFEEPSQSPRRWPAKVFTFEVKSGRHQDHISKVLDDTFELPVNHGEGQFYANSKTLKKIEQSDLVFLRYVNTSGHPTQQYPQNPNGSTNAIAGICDPTGRILGLMPHPEKFVDATQYPNWRREQIKIPHGSPALPAGRFIFEEMIRYVRQ